MSGPWHFDAEKYLAGLAPSPPMTENERKYFRALFEDAARPINPEVFARICREHGLETETWPDGSVHLKPLALGIDGLTHYHDGEPIMAR